MGQVAFSSYNPSFCSVFCKVKEQWGAFSNMAPYPVTLKGERFRTSEALYQALRFPDGIDIQRAIQEQKSPMAAKMVAKKHRLRTREDWDTVRVSAMAWVLALKFQQNFDSLGPLLESTGENHIVEWSTKGDTFWGTKKTSEGILVGENQLGVLLMNLRTSLRRAGAGFTIPEAPPGSKIFGETLKIGFP